MTFASEVESVGSRKTSEEKNMTEKPMTPPAKSAKTTLASLLLYAGSGVAIALGIHAVVKYGRSDAKSDRIHLRRNPLVGSGSKPHPVR